MRASHARRTGTFSFHPFQTVVCCVQIPKDDWFCPTCRPPLASPTAPAHFPADIPASLHPVVSTAPDPDILAELACVVCLSAAQEKKMLLCDSCPAAYHMFCLQPKLTKVPKGDWYCPACRPLPPANTATSSDVTVHASQSEHMCISAAPSSVSPAVQHDLADLHAAASAVRQRGPRSIALSLHFNAHMRFFVCLLNGFRRLRKPSLLPRFHRF
jgi:hypothetical protein